MLTPPIGGHREASTTEGYYACEAFTSKHGHKTGEYSEAATTGSGAPTTAFSNTTPDLRSPIHFDTVKQ